MYGETFTQSNFEGALNIKVELENLKLENIAKIEDLIFNEISSFKDSFLKSFVNKVLANQSSDSELHQQQILLLQKELTNKDNMIQCLVTLIKAGLFEARFSWEGQLDPTPPTTHPLHILRRTYLISI